MRTLVETHGERFANERLPAALPESARGDIFTKVVRCQRVELRVHAWAVIALGVVLHQDLPVSGNVIHLALGESQRFKLESREYVDEVIKVGEERLSRLVEREEDEALPGLTTERYKVVLARIESLQVIGVLRLEQLPIWTVDPGVIWADDLLRLATIWLSVLWPLNQCCAAVAAGIDEGVQFVVFTARDDHLLAGELKEAVRANVRRILFAAHTAPLVAEDLLRLPVEDLLIVIDPRREHVRLIKGATDGGDRRSVEWCRSRCLQHAANSRMPGGYLSGALRRSVPPCGSLIWMRTSPSRVISARPRLPSLPWRSSAP